MKLKEKIKKNKIKIIQGVILSSSMLIAMQVPTMAALGDQVQGVATGISNEIFGLAEVLGVLGILGAGVLFAIGRRKESSGVLISVIIGYLLMKYALPIWNTFRGLS